MPILQLLDVNKRPHPHNPFPGNPGVTHFRKIAAALPSSQPTGLRDASEEELFYRDGHILSSLFSSCRGMAFTRALEGAWGKSADALHFRL